MSVLGIIKFSLGLMALMGFAVMAMGAWKIWAAYDFAAKAEGVPGVFAGYHTERRTEKFRDSDGRTSYRQVEEHFPMFAYRDAAGREQRVTGAHSHVFRVYDYGDKVEVLLPPAGQEASRPGPRLGGFYALYFSSIFTILLGSVFVLAPMGGYKLAQRWMSPPAETNGAHQAPTPADMLQRTRDSVIPVREVVFLVGGLGLIFVVVGGAMYLGFAHKKQDEAVAAQAPPEADHRQIADEAPPPKPAPEPERPVYQQAGSEEIYEAARWGKHEVVAELLAEGDRVYDIRPAAVQALIRKDDLTTLKLIFKDGFDLSQQYARQTFGDQAVAEGRTEIVRLIREHGGVFEAPQAFVALAAEDAGLLREALKADGDTPRFRGMTIERYAERYRKADWLAQAIE